MNRRQYLTTIAVGITGVAGCSGGNSSPGIQIEYNLSDPQTAEEVPDDVVEHPNPEGFYWIVVEFEVVSGSFDASDIMGLTQVEADGSSHFTRAVIITSPDNVRLTSSDDEYSISEGTIGQAYYRFSERPEDPEWVVEQLRNQYGSVEVTQV